MKRHTRSVIGIMLCVWFVAFVALPASADQPISLLKTIAVASDDNLNASRIGCAFGDKKDGFVRLKQRGVKTPDVTTYCIMVMYEAAKRGRLGHLYLRMQPSDWLGEWRLILAASGQGHTRYVNVEKTTKVLNCELALDAGYSYGESKPDQAIAPNLSDHEIIALARRCFEKDTSVTTRDALTAGARIAQAHKKGVLLLVEDQ